MYGLTLNLLYEQVSISTQKIKILQKDIVAGSMLLVS